MPFLASCVVYFPKTDLDLKHFKSSFVFQHYEFVYIKQTTEFPAPWKVEIGFPMLHIIEVVFHLGHIIYTWWSEYFKCPLRI